MVNPARNVKDRDIKITTLLGNFMKLDGGSMFGNAPKTLWQKWLKPDEDNMIDIGARSLLIEVFDYKILFETGPGAYLSPDMKKRFSVLDDDHVLLESLREYGVEHTDITHVILSHLHFDHAGGLLSKFEQGKEKLELLFPNADYITGKFNFERSGTPHIRDQASFIPGLDSLFEDSSRLVLKNDGDLLDIDDVSIEFIESNGHTPGMLLSYIKIRGVKILFVGDLAPGIPWVNLPITMGYDRNAEQLIDEKLRIFKRAYNDKAILFFTHDPVYAAVSLSFDEEKRRFIPIEPQQKLHMIL